MPTRRPFLFCPRCWRPFGGTQCPNCGHAPTLSVFLIQGALGLAFVMLMLIVALVFVVLRQGL